MISPIPGSSSLPPGAVSPTDAPKGKRAYEEEESGGLMGNAGKKIGDIKDKVFKAVTEKWWLSLIVAIALIAIAITLMYAYGYGMFPVSPSGIQDLMMPVLLHGALLVGAYLFVNGLDKGAEKWLKSKTDAGETPSPHLIRFAAAMRKTKQLIEKLIPVFTLAIGAAMVASPFLSPAHVTTFNVNTHIPIYSFDAHGHLLSTSGYSVPWGRGFGDFTFHHVDNGLFSKFADKFVYVVGGTALLGLTGMIADGSKIKAKEYDREIDEINRSNTLAAKKKKELEEERIAALKIQAQGSEKLAAEQRKKKEELEMEERVQNGSAT